MFVISTRNPANKMDKLKKLSSVNSAKTKWRYEIDFSEQECHDSAIGSLLWKVWTICYNQYLIDINIRFPNPILNSETSIISKSCTIPEEDRIYDKDKSNIFSHNSHDFPRSWRNQKLWNDKKERNQRKTILIKIRVHQ
jgi:hypothetical protein